MRTIQINNEVYNVPSKWNDLTDTQVLYLAKLVGQVHSYFNIKIRFCFYLMGLTVKLRNPVMIETYAHYYISNGKKHMYLLSLEQILTIANEFEWLFSRTQSDEGEKISLNPMLTFNPVRTIGVRFTKLKGPDLALGNITWNEFIFAETYLYRYGATLDPKWFNMFLATLWRPVKQGNVIPFDQDKVEQWAKRTAKIKPHIALACTWFYNGCRQYLGRRYSTVFGNGQRSGDPFDSYLDLTTSLARADATKTAEVLSANLHFTIKSLDQMLNQKKPNGAV